MGCCEVPFLGQSQGGTHQIGSQGERLLVQEPLRSACESVPQELAVCRGSTSEQRASHRIGGSQRPSAALLGPEAEGHPRPGIGLCY